jgi:hypothetical protein
LPSRDFLLKACEFAGPLASPTFGVPPQAQFGSLFAAVVKPDVMEVFFGVCLRQQESRLGIERLFFLFTLCQRDELFAIQHTDLAGRVKATLRFKDH